MCPNQTETLVPFARSPACQLSRAADAFREMRDPAAAYLHSGMAGAVDGLLRIADDGNAGCGLLTGAAGLGKSLVRSVVQRQASSQRCALVVVESALFGFDDLLLEMLSQLRGERITAQQLPGRYERVAELKSLLATEMAGADRHVVLCLDEADQYECDTLAAVASLLNLTSDRQTFIVPLFFGTPALRVKLARLPSLQQRIGSEFTLQPLAATECAGYLQHRLRFAGLDGQLAFEPGLAVKLHSLSNGVPRVLDTLCRNALTHAASHRLPAAGQASVDAARRLLPGSGPVLSAVALGH